MLRGVVVTKKPLKSPETLWSVVVIMLALSNGLLVGTLLGLISDFGIRNTAENMQANPEMFANQYAGGLVYAAWFALVSLVALVAAVCVQYKFGWKRNRTCKESQL